MAGVPILGVFIIFLDAEVLRPWVTVRGVLEAPLRIASEVVV